MLCALVLCAAEARGAEPRRYEVRSGDTLRQIARRELGDVARWREIAQLNGMKDDALREGQILLLPVSPSRPSAADMPPVFAVSPPEAPLSYRPPAVESAREAPLLSATGGGGSILWPAAAVLAALCAFLAVSLRIACWFALVETSLGRCALLAVVLSFLTAAVLVAGVAADSETFRGWPLAGQPLLRFGGICAMGFLLGAALTRWLLGCRWRSVVTVYLMSLVVAGALTVGCWHGLAVAEASGRISPAWRNYLRHLSRAVEAESRNAATACSAAYSAKRE